MRRVLVLAALSALLLPSAGTAMTRATGDGTLSVRDGRGVFTVNARGGIIGSFAKGKVIIVDPVEEDGTGPIVSGDDWRTERGETTTIWGGTKVRFRVIGGAFKVRVIGRGVNLSVVGRGTATLNGEGTLDDGAFSLNGGDYELIPEFALTLSLGSASP